MIGDETDQIIKDLFDSLLQKYQKGLEESIKESEFVFDNGELLYYKLHRMSLNRVRSFIDSPKWLKNKKATINIKNNDDKCLQYVVAVALNQEKSFPKGISNIKPIINQHRWKKIFFPSNKKDGNGFEKNNKTIALNMLYVPYNTEEISHAYKSKYNLKSEKCKDHGYCYIEMPKENNKILKFNHREKSMKVSYIVYADIQSLLQKMSTFHTNPKKPSTTKINTHTTFGYSLFTHCSFDATEDKLDCYRGHDCVKKFRKGLKEHATKIISYE